MPTKKNLVSSSPTDESLNPPLEPVEPDFDARAVFAVLKELSAGLLDLHDAPAYQASTLARQEYIRGLQAKIANATTEHFLTLDEPEK